MYTKQHYQDIATTLHSEMPDVKIARQWNQWARVRNAFAVRFRKDNPRFNWPLFEYASSTGDIMRRKVPHYWINTE